MSETVYVASTYNTASRIYHTTECENVQRKKGVKEKPIEYAEKRGMRECKFCSGEVVKRGGDKSAYLALKNAAND